jgi:uncharacterized SAM-binding protein YcdF (DUF218 family)
MKGYQPPSDAGALMAATSRKGATPDLRSRQRRMLRLTSWGGAAFLALFLVGFVVFATHVSRLAAPRTLPIADAIIVLTGGQYRLNAAVDLLTSGKGERLLISGAHPSAGRDAIRAATGGQRWLFSCCVDIDHVALDTIGNAEESAKWVRSHAYGRVILVTNNYHMPRSLLELGRLLDDVKLEPYPVVNTRLDHGAWMGKPEALRVLFTEYNKYLLALARGALPGQPGGTALAGAKPAETGRSAFAILTD